ncbi:MAG: hypothetical protein OXD29_04270 [Roseovarius sp.]|nr:hypothetical protein [Roseovarius sp.]
MTVFLDWHTPYRDLSVELVKKDRIGLTRNGPWPPAARASSTTPIQHQPSQNIGKLNLTADVRPSALRG